MAKRMLRRILPPLVVVSVLLSVAGNAAPVRAQQVPRQLSIIHKVRADNERLEMTVNTSRRLTLDQKIPEAQVNNPEILELTPLSPDTIQVSAKRPGVTQVNLWGEDGKVYTIDVIVYGDARELAMLLKSQFPNASLKVVPVASGVLISGFVDQPGHVGLIIRIAEEYYPKVINNITVSGVRQVLLHVKVMEVSRTKMRALGFDWSQISDSNVFHSGISGLLTAANPAKNEIVDGLPSVTPASVLTKGSETFSFSVLHGTDAFFGVLEALREDRLAKILAEPTIVAVSGRPAKFLVGGEVGYPLNGGITGPSAEFREFGTQLDFVAIVLGNGRIRLEVRPRVSQVDWSLGAAGVPGFRTRMADTGVELQAGQTLAIAGLVETRVEAQNRGLPWVSDVPFLGMLFRRVQEQNNEVELLIMVTPELVEAMDAHEVPPCGPGMRTTSPSDWELFINGYPEVPNCGPPCPTPGYPHGVHPGGPTPMMLPPGGTIIEQHEEIQSPRPTAPGGARSPSSQPAAAVSHNRYTPSKRQFSRADSRHGKQNVEPGFIGPIGYDVLK